MSAQYRPYRDEESVDGMEAASWSDNEPVQIQIYEKTTEELPFTSARYGKWWHLAGLLFLFSGLGFLLGYFAHFHPATTISTGDPELDLSLVHVLRALYEEESSIKGKLLETIDGNKILTTLENYKDTNRIPGSDTDHEFARKIHDSFNEFNFDRITSTNYAFKTMLPKKPSVVKLLTKDNKTIYSNIDQEFYAHDDMRPFLPLSQANETFITTNQILYVNRGMKDDYTKLTTLGISANETEGKILVIRQTFYQAHDVVINAQESGAIAILLFPDPDFYGDSSPFPKSVRLPNDAARSHPTAWTNYGDLASFNLTALTGIDSSKLALDKEPKVQIPVVPISFKTATHILRGLSGVQAPSDWNCFDFTLYLGPGYKEENNNDQRNKLGIEFHNVETSITSVTVTGIIMGSVEPDRYVVVGSRRDSLNRGLLDSVSGSAVMLELARVFGVLLKDGWRPRRTIIFNSFGAESLNLIGSSNWLEIHQRILHARAVAYLNCDLVVTGNHSAVIAGSPLLYQVLYNATKQVLNPNLANDPSNKFVYDAWKAAQHITKEEDESSKFSDPELEKMFESYDSTSSRLVDPTAEKSDDPAEEGVGSPGGILHEFRKSAGVKTRPKFRRLDLQSIYSPFFLYAGIPAVDVRYAGFSSSSNQSNFILQDTMPLLGSKYDNMAAIQHIDPHLKYHVAVTQVLAEILRDLSDSVFLPFNLLDYAVTMKDSFGHFAAQHGSTFSRANVDLATLKQTIIKFSLAALEFHHRQDQVNLRDAMKVRKFNDQLMMIERAFLDSTSDSNYWERKHIILSPNDGQEQGGGFPGLVDWLTVLDGYTLDQPDYLFFIEILKVQYKSVVHTISNAIKIISDVYIL